ncbi:MAG: redoxin domain-containing protein [Alphaproteobacteria bacterium]|nr:redoxin domain-containing protein [Alphaproteobacteria bacterium]
MTKLTPDAPVPALSVPKVGGGTFTLNENPPGLFTMVLFYRGLHCPVCKSYLERFNGLVADYRGAGFDVIAVSMNDEATATQAKSDWDISDVPLAYGLSEADARAWGLYISHNINENEAPVFCEPGTFWVLPDGRLYLGDVSNMPWARPDLEFLLSKVAVVKQRNYPARGVN